MTKATDILTVDNITLASGDEESNEFTIEDEDTCSPFELEQHFQKKFCVHDETAVTLSKSYILGLTKDEAFTRIACGLSDGSVHLFDISSERGLSCSLPDCIAPPLSLGQQNQLSICGVRFMDETSNLLLVGTTNNLIRLFDLRIQVEVGSFYSNSENKVEYASMPKKMVCFDRNSNSRLLCVGTEQHHNNGLLLFYDLRERKELGGYINTHQDDVTTVRFHPQNPDLLCSGSTDGLINIFDLQKTTEDDALLITLNTVSSVHKLNWHKNVYRKDIISCITHTNDFKLYQCEEGDIIAQFERAEVTERIKRKAIANCNLIDCHNMAEEQLFLLTGSNLNKGEVMRSLLVQNKELFPGFDFQGNKQIVRESVLDLSSNVLITAGESCAVTLWTQQTTTNVGSSNFKAKEKKTNKISPY